MSFVLLSEPRALIQQHLDVCNEKQRSSRMNSADAGLKTKRLLMLL